MSILITKLRKLPFSTKLQVAKALGIDRSGPVTVAGNVVTIDGFTEDNLKDLTKERMELFLNATGDIEALFDEVVLRVTEPGKYNTPIQMSELVIEQPAPVEPAPKNKGGRPSGSKNKKA